MGISVRLCKSNIYRIFGILEFSCKGESILSSIAVAFIIMQLHTDMFPPIVTAIFPNAMPTYALVGIQFIAEGYRTHSMLVWRIHP